MKIGRVAKDAKVNIQTLRYYERVGMIKPESRDASGYRMYAGDSVKRVGFIKKAQELGFTLAEIKELLTLRGNSAQSRSTARKKASAKLAVIRGRIADLKSLEKTLQGLIKDCERGSLDGPCPILEKMEGRGK
jgi:DNA-binding transcriptional MerR regulator